MSRLSRLLWFGPVLLLSCAHAPPPFSEPPISAEQRLWERERDILAKSREALFAFSFPSLLPYQSFYERHGIVVRWVADSTFQCQSQSGRSCELNHPRDFYVCPITSERLDGDPLLAATYNREMNMLWLTNAEVSPAIRMLMIVGELSIAGQAQTLGPEPSGEEESSVLQRLYFLMYGLLDELTDCAWSAVVLESAREQQRVIDEEALDWEVSLPFGSPRDGRLISRALHEDYFVDSPDRGFLLSMIRIHSTFARFELHEIEQPAALALTEIELQFPTD